MDDDEFWNKYVQVYNVYSYFASFDYAKQKNIPLYLAGGINPLNVREIIEEYRPLMLDVSSGLEKSPGKKDEVKIKKFFKFKVCTWVKEQIKY